MAVVVLAADVVVGSSWWQVLDLQDQADVVSRLTMGTTSVTIRSIRGIILCTESTWPSK